MTKLLPKFLRDVFLYNVQQFLRENSVSFQTIPLTNDLYRIPACDLDKQYFPSLTSYRFVCTKIKENYLRKSVCLFTRFIFIGERKRGVNLDKSTYSNIHFKYLLTT